MKKDKEEFQGYEIPKNNLTETDIAQSLTTYLEQEKRDKNFEIALAITLNSLSKIIDTLDSPKILQESWKLIYRQKPPFTMQEFLTPEWLGPMAKKIYPHVRKDLIEFFDINKPYRNLYLVSSIGSGKSTMSTIIALFLVTHVTLMWNPKAFFDKAPTTFFAVVLGSFTLSQGKKLLLKPFMELLITSPKFRRVKQSDRIEIAQNEEYEKGTNRIVWSTASRVDGDIEFYNDIHVLRVSEASSLLGMNIICGMLSELSFFLDKGVSPEAIDRFRTDLDSRINSRLQGHYLGRMVIDSSPNTMDSPIDKYVFSGKVYEDKRNMVVHRKFWDMKVHREGLSQYLKDMKNNVFYVYRGGGGDLPKLIDKEETRDFHPEDVYAVPIDLKPFFTEDTLPKAIKDYCAYPTTNDRKLISDFKQIESIFSFQLHNIEQYITAPDNEPPERLIWDQIKDKFFVKDHKGDYHIYRAENEDRFIHVDQSEKNDTTGISMAHKEWNTKKNKFVCVLDFTIAINSTILADINLDAIVCFIIDLYELGNLNIAKVTFDQYQSSAGRQRLERVLDIKIDRFSVDSDPSIYYTFVSYIKQKRIKAGRNIYLKNNLKSLQNVVSEKGKVKVDHTKGKIVKIKSGDWDTDTQGINAKDVSDSACGACFHVIQTDNDYIPEYEWIDDDIMKKRQESNENHTLNKVLKDLQKQGLTR